MSATTETQSPSEKHRASLNQLHLLLNLPAGILGKAFGNINRSSTWGSLIGITNGFYVLFSMIMETGWMLLFLFYAAAIIVSGSIAGTVVSVAAGNVQVEVIML